MGKLEMISSKLQKKLELYAPYLLCTYTLQNCVCAAFHLHFGQANDLGSGG